MKKLLDSKVVLELRNTVNKSDIFIKDKKKSYNVLCVTMDGIDSAIKYINKNFQKLKKNLLYIYFMFAMLLKQ